MKRRTLVLATGGMAATAAAAGWVGLAALRPPASRTAARVTTWSEALAWAQGLAVQSVPVRTTSGWTAAQVLEHLAQSIEYSMRGFAQSKPAWFQNTVGAAAFSAFKTRQRMRHGLTDVIPGAPAFAAAAANALDAQALLAAQARLVAAMVAFDACAEGLLQPHFAYGRLSKADYGVAHALHVDNHLDVFA